jgi:signal transduction histidine kinase
VNLIVADYGEGIPTEERDRVFELFYRSSQSQEGSGIGLTFCRRLAEAQGGDLRYEQNEPTGARFILSLPAIGKGHSQRTSRPSHLGIDSPRPF